MKTINICLIALLSIFLLILAAPTSADAQVRTNPRSNRGLPDGQPDGRATNIGKRIFVSGDVGFNFGNNAAYILLAPVVGYRLLESRSLAVAAGPSYEFFKSGPIGYNGIGGRAFARYNIIQSLFAHAEFEAISYKDNLNYQRELVTRLPLGGGYRQQLVGNTYLNLTILYDFLYDAESRYNNTSYNGLIFRGGVTVGL